MHMDIVCMLSYVNMFVYMYVQIYVYECLFVYVYVFSLSLTFLDECHKYYTKWKYL